MPNTPAAPNLKALSESEWTADKAQQYLKKGRLDVAEELLSQAVKKRKDAVGAEEAGVAEWLGQLGDVKCRLGKYQEAHECFDSAISIFEKIFYPQHYRLGPVLSNKATCYIHEGNFEAALDVCNRALDIFSKTLSGEHRLTLEATYKLATIYRQLKKPDEALKLIAKAKKNVETPLGPLEEFTFLEAMLQEDLSKPDLADKAFQETIRGLKQRHAVKRLSDCLARYADFLKKQGRDDEARRAEEQADHYRAYATTQSRSEDIFPSTLLRA